MIAEFVEGFLQVIDPNVLVMMMAAILIGLFFGAVPGIGGNLTLALLIPFVFGMDTMSGLAFLLAAHAVVATGSAITAVLVNTPGAAMSAATCLDGYPMTQKGQGGRALGASLASSAVGGVIGAFTLLLVIPVIRPLVASFRPPEIFMLAILGISFISVLSTKGAYLKGLIAGGVGLLFGLVGFDPFSGLIRFNFGTVYLYEGFDIVPVVVGLFAVCELMDLIIRGGTISKVVDVKDSVWEGVRDTFRHWWLTVRCSMMGSVIGAIPGLGGDVVNFLAYGHAVQSSKNPHEFGTGRVEGVLAPESANNAKEGGSLIPTVAFGVPGSSGMAILLGAFLILGLTPGPEMLTKNLNVVFFMVWVLVISNIIGATICLFGGGILSKIAVVKSEILVPVLFSVATWGAYSMGVALGDIVTAYMFGLVGHLMKRFDYPRVVLILGLILGSVAERNLWLSVTLYGGGFLLRPIVMVELAIVVALLASPLYKMVRTSLKGGAAK